MQQAGSNSPGLSNVVGPSKGRIRTAMPSKYVLVEWESDSTVSVVPTSRLKTRDGKRVTQAWPGGVFAGSILQESGRTNTSVAIRAGVEVCMWQVPV